MQKLDKRILPLTCLLYLFACSCFFSFDGHKLMCVRFNHNPALDRSNLGNARLQGLPEDVLGGDKTGVLFDWLTSGFYFSYVCLSRMTIKDHFLTFKKILFHIPATIFSKLFLPQVFVALAAIGWGLTSTLMVRDILFPVESGFFTVLSPQDLTSPV